MTCRQSPRAHSDQQNNVTSHNNILSLCDSHDITIMHTYALMDVYTFVHTRALTCVAELTWSW